jgi:hypothetical protein
MPIKSEPINLLLQEKQIAYLAGLFDGEGSVGIYEFKKQNKFSNWQFKVEIANTDWRVMKWLENTVGGKVHKKSEGKANWRQGYCWHIQGENAEVFCKLVKPYTIIKTDQIDACLYFRKFWGVTNKKQTEAILKSKREMVDVIKQLKRKDYANCQ